MKTKKIRPLHFGAWGRTTSACGITLTPGNMDDLKFRAEHDNPKCRECQGVLEAARQLEPIALVLTSQDNSLNAFQKARTAVRAARALARSLGPGWKPRVWENLGWHYCAWTSVLGSTVNLEVHRSGRGYLIMGDNVVGHGKTLKAALKDFDDNVETRMKPMHSMRMIGYMTEIFMKNPIVF